MSMVLLEDCIKVTYNDNQGGKVIKIIDPEDLVNVLSKRVPMNTGLLPRNTRCYFRSEDTEILVLEVPQHIRDVHFFTGSTFLVPFPPTLHILRIRNLNKGASKYLVDNYCFALKVSLMNDDTELYKFPFGNVSDYNGKVCWGDIDVPCYEDVSLFSSIPELLFSSTFNTDYDSNIFIPFEDENGMDVTRGSHLMRYLAGKSVFPTNILIKLGTFKTELKHITG